MAKQTQRNSTPSVTRGLTDEEWQDPDQWEEEGWILEGHPPAGSVYAVRFERDELERIEDAAVRAGLTTTEFIRRSTLSCAAE
jgi:hypothetical protein